MTTIQTAIRFARFGLVASLVCGGLLIGSMHRSSAGEIAAAPVSAATQDAGQSDATTAQTPVVPVRDTAPLTGTVGFGWG